MFEFDILYFELSALRHNTEKEPRDDATLREWQRTTKPTKAGSLKGELAREMRFTFAATSLLLPYIAGCELRTLSYSFYTTRNNSMLLSDPLKLYNMGSHYNNAKIPILQYVALFDTNTIN